MLQGWLLRCGSLQLTPFISILTHIGVFAWTAERQIDSFYTPSSNMAQPSPTNNSNGGAFSVSGCAIPTVLGCTDPTAVNWDPGANTDDGSCFFVQLTDNIRGSPDRRLCGRADVNGDFAISFLDILDVLAVFGLPGSMSLERDVDQDGTVSTPDLLAVMNGFGMTCTNLEP